MISSYDIRIQDGTSFSDTFLVRGAESVREYVYLQYQVGDPGLDRAGNCTLVHTTVGEAILSSQSALC
jgi:hypothetical protein